MQSASLGVLRQSADAIYAAIEKPGYLSEALAFAAAEPCDTSHQNSGNPSERLADTLPLPSSTTAPCPASDERPTHRAPLVELAAAALDSAITSGR